MTHSQFATLALLAVLSAGSALAQDAAPRHAPPPEAFTACQGKSTSETCSVGFEGRSLAGTCSPAEDNRLFCRPSQPPRGPGLPPEALAACDAEAADAACTVTLPDRVVEGTCAAGRDGRLFCRPSQPPPER